MHLMTEDDRFHIFFRREVILDRLEQRMTFLAVVGNRKCVLTVMAETAGKTFFHISHRETSVQFGRHKGFIVAVVAAVEFSMNLVAEYRP